MNKEQEVKLIAELLENKIQQDILKTEEKEKKELLFTHFQDNNITLREQEDGTVRIVPVTRKTYSSDVKDLENEVVKQKKQEELDGTVKVETNYSLRVNAKKL